LSDDLREIVILEHLSDEMLERLIPAIDLLTFEEQEKIFEEDGEADHFYMLKRGKVLLEKHIAAKITVSLGAVKPGYSFGWSSLTGVPYSSDAICAETSDIFRVRADTMLELLNTDHHMGFLVMRSLTRMIKNRLDRMEEQFMRAMREHPDIATLIE